MEMMLLVRAEPKLSGRMSDATDVEAIEDVLVRESKQPRFAIQINVGGVEQVTYTTEYVLQRTDSLGGWMRSGSYFNPERAQEALAWSRSRTAAQLGVSESRLPKWRVITHKIIETELDW